MLMTADHEIYDPEQDACHGCGPVPPERGAHYHSPSRGVLFLADFPPAEQIAPWVQIRVPWHPDPRDA